ncbi:MAG: VTT domain-containing protein [Planctomycetota bacterium]
MSDRRRLALLLAVLAAAVLAALLLPLGAWLESYLSWAEGFGAAGAWLVAALFLPGCVLMVPGTPITFVCAFGFGFAATLPPIVLCTNLGAQLAFLAGRTLLRGPVERRVAGDEKLLAIDRAVASAGFRTVLLLRLSPLVPFNALNYALGASPVRFRDYALGTFIGMLAGNVLTVYLGTALATLAQALRGEAEVGLAGQALFALGLAATLVLVVFVSRRARRELDALTSRP